MSRSPSGARGSISALPAIMRRPSGSASAKKASIDCGMHGAEHRSRGDAVTEALGEEPAPPRARARGRRNALLGREGVTLEPVDELLAVGRHDPGLHIVHMRVDEAGRDQAAGMVR